MEMSSAISAKLKSMKRVLALIPFCSRRSSNDSSGSAKGLLVLDSTRSISERRKRKYLACQRMSALSAGIAAKSLPMAIHLAST